MVEMESVPVMLFKTRDYRAVQDANLMEKHLCPVCGEDTMLVPASRNDQSKFAFARICPSCQAKEHNVRSRTNYLKKWELFKNPQKFKE